MKYHDGKASVGETAHSSPSLSAESIVSAQELSELATVMHMLWMRMSRGVAQPVEIQGLLRQQCWVLLALSSGPRRMSDLAACAQTSQASLTGIVDRLEEHGLVERTRSADDRRVVEVALTAEGARVSRAADEAFATRLGQIVQPLESDERHELLRLMRKLTTGTTR